LESAEKESFLRWLPSVGYQFRHIGWHPVAFWVGRPVSLCLKKPDGSFSAALLTSPDRLQVAWLHLFAAGAPPGARAAWNRLWPEAKGGLARMKVPFIWVMTTLDWMIDLIRASGFTETDRVVAYALLPARPIPADGDGGALSPMEETDLQEIERLDQAAFSPPWQMDSEALREMRERSIWAAVLRREGVIAGYIMASRTPQGIHITRVAVHPRDQNRGVGRLLLVRLINLFHRQGVPRITVNTQIENRRSRRLYQSLGFTGTGESYPVFRIDPSSP
jgi:ribosomal protein S18 acetylase RimI-like enzyme